MSKQKLTKTHGRQTVRIAADIDAALVASMDHERSVTGQCSRAVIIRMALLDRYRGNASSVTGEPPSPSKGASL